MKKVLLKLSGEVIPNDKNGIDTNKIKDISKQIKSLIDQDYLINIVIGGGNFFRGAQQSKHTNLSLQASHYTGMLSTIMNAIIVQDVFNHTGINNLILSAIQCPQVAQSISNQNINQAIKNKEVIIFAGGIGTPYFTTDTNAIVRGLQTNSDIVWKATKVNGIYNKDPKKYPNATIIKNISYKEAISKNLKVMDQTAFSLAKENKLPIRIFNVFEKDAILKAAKNKDFGSIIN